MADAYCLSLKKRHFPTVFAPQNIMILCLVFANLRFVNSFNWIITNAQKLNGALDFHADSPIDENGSGREDKFSVSHPRSLRPLLRQELKINATVKTLERLQASTSDTQCSQDSQCGEGLFCDTHYSECRSIRKAGETCRSDGQCMHSFDCMFGRCLPHIPFGQKGARCNPEVGGTCHPRHCCARQHGEWVCKPRLRQGKICFVPSGGLAYSLNEQCPCAEGLICGETSRKDGSDKEWLTPWVEQRRFRCVPFELNRR